MLKLKTLLLCSAIGQALREVNRAERKNESYKSKERKRTTATHIWQILNRECAKW